ncbi:predicted protein, partial [Uncinocarpus reesii 1704]
KLKPRVEQVCRDLGLQYCTEDNAGRMYVNLTGGPAQMPSYPPHQHHHPQHAPQPHHGEQQQQENTLVEQAITNGLPRLLRKLEKACCIVM